MDIKNDRDYAIRKGKVLAKFTEEFWERHRHNPMFVSVWEHLIRDADPYDIIEKLIEINDTQRLEMIKILEGTPTPIIISNKSH